MSGRCHVYVNMAVQPSLDAHDVVGLVFLHNSSWWDVFNLPPLTRRPERCVYLRPRHSWIWFFLLF